MAIVSMSAPGQTFPTPRPHPIKEVVRYVQTSGNISTHKAIGN